MTFVEVEVCVCCACRYSWVLCTLCVWGVGCLCPFAVCALCCLFRVVFVVVTGLGGVFCVCNFFMAFVEQNGGQMGIPIFLCSF